VNDPLTLRVQLHSLSARIEVTDALDELVCLIRKKKLKFREHVTVYADRHSRRPLCEIREANTSPDDLRYSFSEPTGREFGSLSRNTRSHPRRPAPYVVSDASGDAAFVIRPKGSLSRTARQVLCGLPVAGRICHRLLPSGYRVLRPDGRERFRLRRRAAFRQILFELREVPSQEPDPVPEEDRFRLLMAILLIVLLELSRG